MITISEIVSLFLIGKKIEVFCGNENYKKGEVKDGVGLKFNNSWAKYKHVVTVEDVEHARKKVHANYFVLRIIGESGWWSEIHVGIEEPFYVVGFPQ